ncbi:oxidoreductase-like protein [Chytriomyces sp. MP71]|nr:oxidoreductase-like protein [Chytriomyces sp. MP71]
MSQDERQEVRLTWSPTPCSERMTTEPGFDVLVTGSSGHLGTALMHALPSLGYRPLGMDILASDMTHVIGSVSDRALVHRVFAANPSIRNVIHAATLHKPHVGSHEPHQFIDTNIAGTQALLDSAKDRKVDSFIFISTTSTFGDALSPAKGSPAAWIDEDVRPVPKNIYGATKCAGEDLCYLASKNHGLPVIVLRTSRFFPELDDDPKRRDAVQDDDNLKVLELAYRRVDIADIVSVCHRAMVCAGNLRWARFIISAPTPFANDPDTLRLLNENAEEVFARVAPETVAVFSRRGWKFLLRLDRVYDSSKALKELDWHPVYTFSRAVGCVDRGEEWRSELALLVGKKGYHAVNTGVYTQK